MGHEPFTWVSLIPGLSQYPYIGNSLIISVVLLLIVIFGYVQLKRTAEEVIPDERLTFRNFLEIIVEAILGLVDGTMGPHGRKFVLLVGPFSL